MALVEDAIAEIMRRNVLEVFGQRDRTLRRAAIAELYAEDASFADPEGSAVGRDEIDAAAERVLAQFPDLEFAVATAPSSVTDLGRVTWELRTAGGVPKASGTDVATVSDGRITRIWTFLQAPTDTPATGASASQ